MTGIWSGISSKSSPLVGAGVEDGAFSWCRYDEAGEPSRDECLKNDNFGRSLWIFKIFSKQSELGSNGLIKEVGKKISDLTGEKRSTSFLLQSISIANWIWQWIQNIAIF